MADKTFTVSHAHARKPIVVKGPNLAKALEKEGLDLAIWKEVKPSGEPEPADNG